MCICIGEVCLYVAGDVCVCVDVLLRVVGVRRLYCSFKLPIDNG